MPPYCDRCGEPIPANRILCKRCGQGNSAAYEWSYAPYQYDGSMLKAIHRLKYDGRTALAKPLGKLLASALPNCDPLLDGRTVLDAFDVVIPVPLHPSRLKTRGFNQAELLAREVCAGTGWHLEIGNLQRVRKTPTQTAMTMEERAANVLGAFTLRETRPMLHKQVLIVDDVLTSTSTAREIARVIAEAGASRVCVCALARSA